MPDKWPVPEPDLQAEGGAPVVDGHDEVGGVVGALQQQVVQHVVDVEQVVSVLPRVLDEVGRQRSVYEKAIVLNLNAQAKSLGLGRAGILQLLATRPHLCNNKLSG